MQAEVAQEVTQRLDAQQAAESKAEAETARVAREVTHRNGNATCMGGAPVVTRRQDNATWEEEQRLVEEAEAAMRREREVPSRLPVWMSGGAPKAEMWCGWISSHPVRY